jgi:ABC-type phosphate transport system auxiliary subunit
MQRQTLTDWPDRQRPTVLQPPESVHPGPPWIWLVTVVFASVVLIVIIVVLGGVALGFAGLAAQDDD